MYVILVKEQDYNSYSELTDYHKGDYTTYYEKCKKCNGTGKLFRTKKFSISISYEPFDSKKACQKNIRYKLDEKK